MKLLSTVFVSFMRCAAALYCTMKPFVSLSLFDHIIVKCDALTQNKTIRKLKENISVSQIVLVVVILMLRLLFVAESAPSERWRG